MPNGCHNVCYVQSSMSFILLHVPRYIGMSKKSRGIELRWDKETSRAGV